MALTTVPLPYGIRDIKITPYTDAAGTTLGTAVDLPYGRVLTFSESEDFEELRGDDVVVTERGKGAKVAWDLEGGGVSLEVVKALVGGTLGTTGTTPSQVKSFVKMDTDARPWFKIEGQVISDSGGDLHCIIYKCRATGDLGIEFSDGSFSMTAASGSGIGATLSGHEGEIYEFVHNETAAAIA